MIHLSNVALTVTPSPIRKMFNYASHISDVVNFTVGEPDFLTPRNIIEAADRALMRGEMKYTLNAGMTPLRNAIAVRVQSSYGYSVDPDRQIIVTAGGMEALFLCMTTLINPGDEVIVSDPHWSNYPRQVLMCGGIPRYVQVFEKDGFVFDPENVRKAITPKTRLIILNSPANPTGAVADRATLRELAEIAIEHDLIVISDEVYQNFVYDDTEFVSISTFPGMQERTVIIDSFSKSYAMTGWRIGFAVGPEEIIKNMVKLHENVVSCINPSAQYGAIEALEGTQEPLKNMVRKYAERRKLIIDGINSIDRLSCIPPKGAFYAFVNITGTQMKSEDFAIRLLQKTGVVVVPGSGFGEAGEGFIRISYATSEDNILKGLNRMHDFMLTLNGK